MAETTQNITVSLNMDKPIKIEGLAEYLGASEKAKSAYEIALAHGFVGSEQEWLDSLKGPKGDTGYGAPGNTGQDGRPGKSAYDIAYDNGFRGTEAEWLKSLKGGALTSLQREYVSKLIKADLEKIFVDKTIEQDNNDDINELFAGVDLQRKYTFKPDGIIDPLRGDVTVAVGQTVTVNVVDKEDTDVIYHTFTIRKKEMPQGFTYNKVITSNTGAFGVIHNGVMVEDVEHVLVDMDFAKKLTIKFFGSSTVAEWSNGGNPGHATVGFEFDQAEGKVYFVSKDRVRITSTNGIDGLKPDNPSIPESISVRAR